MFILRSLDPFCPVICSGPDPELLWLYCDSVLGVTRANCWMEIARDLSIPQIDLAQLKEDLSEREEELDEVEENLDERKASLDEKEEELDELRDSLEAKKLAIRRCWEVLSRGD